MALYLGNRARLSYSPELSMVWVDPGLVGSTVPRVPYFYKNYIKLTKVGSSRWHTDSITQYCPLRLTRDIVVGLVIYRDSI